MSQMDYNASKILNVKKVLQKVQMELGVIAVIVTQM